MSWDRERIFGLLLEGGEIALRSRKNLRREFKQDQSIVTQADREIEALCARRLEDAAAGVYFIGEETVNQKGEDYIQRALREECYVVDPIDGTSPYAHGLPYWGVSIGRMEGGSITDGAIYLPALGEVVLSDGKKVMEGSLENGAWNWRELPAPRREPGTSGLVAITQAVAKRGKVLLKNPVLVVGAAVVPLAGLVQGRILAYLGSVRLWDVAGALALVQRFDFSVTVREGSEIRRVGAGVNDHVYRLEPGTRGRWFFRSDLLICYPEDEQKMRKALVRSGGIPASGTNDQKASKG